MREKYDLLSQLFLEARKKGDKFAVSVYSTMKGEIDTEVIGQTSPNYDDLIERYALKSKKNLEEFKPERFEDEIELLTPFFPKEVTPEEVKAFINTLKSEDVDAKQWMGRIMRNFKGLDPKLVMSLINEMK